jgi:hypothetical protein
MRFNSAVQRVSTTVVALLGEQARACLDQLEHAANVGTARPDPSGPPLERAVAAWQGAARSHTPYLLHDADPLEAVATAWVRRFDEQGPAGELEVALAETLQRWRAGAIELPDYYLTLDADTWPETRRHFYLGFLHRAAPSRVVPLAGVPGQVMVELGRLRSGRWWPPLDRLLDGVDQVVADRA